jgi:hypothetical protein
MGGDLFKLQWKTSIWNTGKKGIVVSVGGKFLFFLQEDSLTVAESQTSVLVLKAIERTRQSLEWSRKKASSPKACGTSGLL